MPPPAFVLVELIALGPAFLLDPPESVVRAQALERLGVGSQGNPQWLDDAKFWTVSHKC